MAERRLSPDEAALWRRVMASVRPLGKPAALTTSPLPQITVPAKPQPSRPLPVKPTRSAKPGVTLDGKWDRELTRGMIVPDRSIDLHGHGLQSAYMLLDQALERAIAQGDRVLLLVTGKAPDRDSQRPHARGAIRAAVGDWLAASRFGDRIAAVRGAHPRHGGAGALYIILRRPRQIS